MPTEAVDLRGHIIDSLLLPRVLDAILADDAEFEIEEVRIGHRREEPSFARIRIHTEAQPAMDALLADLQAQGADLVNQGNVAVLPAPQEGVFPEGFYSTTNLRTSIRWRGAWLPVDHLEMDCGIRLDPASGSARCLPMHRVRRGDALVVGFEGVRVTPPERPPTGELFEFMGSSVSSEKPKRRLAAEIAQWLVGGLFAGNGLATHDLEAALHGTSLGVPLAGGRPHGSGHQNHLRTINTVRSCGGIRQAVAQGLVTRGIMHACVVTGTPFILAGSIRDDGPLPEVITDAVEAMDAVRALVPQVDTVLVIGSMLHAIAVGNVLPAAVRLVVVDINPAALTKIMDRGSFQTLGIVSDADLFLHQLVGALTLSGAQEG